MIKLRIILILLVLALAFFMMMAGINETWILSFVISGALAIFLGHELLIRKKIRHIEQPFVFVRKAKWQDYIYNSLGFFLMATQSSQPLTFGFFVLFQSGLLYFFPNKIYFYVAQGKLQDITDNKDLDLNSIRSVEGEGNMLRIHTNAATNDLVLDLSELKSHHPEDFIQALQRERAPEII